MAHKLRNLIYLSPNDIKPNPLNPRKHGKTQIKALAKSIKAFDFNAPLLVDRDHKLIAGHGRLEAAKLLNLAQVPVICLNELKEHEAIAYMLADNKLSDRSSWDEPLLAAHLKELSELTVEFDLEATGFEAPEIDIRISSLEEDDLESADDYEVSVDPPVTQVGDTWMLGQHILHCGSALEPASYAGFLKSRAAAIFTDPPWNLPIDGFVSGLGKVKHREFPQASGEMSPEAFMAFLVNAVRMAKQCSSDGAVHYWCIDFRHMREMLEAGTQNALDFLNLCIWVKTNGGMGSFYRSRHELVFVFRNGATSHRNNVQLGRFGRNRTNVWHYPGANVRSSQNALQHHPTAKPIRLVADALRDCTDRGDYVLDPFLGSGTTLLAAEQSGRKCLAIELDPIYVDTAIDRWKRLTGQEARLVSGEAFSDVKAMRVAQ